jgi:uncharacterized protein (TIGR03435 family)
MSALAMGIEGRLRQPMGAGTQRDIRVQDKTGLAGRYTFHFYFEPPGSHDGGDLFTALENQLGLKLEPRNPSDRVERVVVSGGYWIPRDR